MKEINDLKIVNSGEATEARDKRFYIPATVEWTCPKCGEANVEVFEDFPYPEFNNSFKHDLYCRECEEGFEVSLKIEINLRKG